MPLQNRVLPTGEIVAIPARGTLTGNRGIIHRDGRRLGTSRWSHHAWICCTLDWEGRQRQVMTGRKWTELFFLDEAVAMAAGHRPCGYCRRPAYNDFVDAWTEATGAHARAKDMDKVLQAARIVKGSRDQKRYAHAMSDLPNYTMVLHEDQPHLVHDDRLLPFAPHGYGSAVAKPAADALVLTPAPMVAALRAGFSPQLHPTARL